MGKKAHYTRTPSAQRDPPGGTPSQQPSKQRSVAEWIIYYLNAKVVYLGAPRCEKEREKDLFVLEDN